MEQLEEEGGKVSKHPQRSEQKIKPKTKVMVAGSEASGGYLRKHKTGHCRTVSCISLKHGVIGWKLIKRSVGGYKTSCKTL